MGVGRQSDGSCLLNIDGAQDIYIVNKKVGSSIGLIVQYVGFEGLINKVAVKFLVDILKFNIVKNGN